MKYSNTRQRILAVEKILLTTKYKLKISEIIEELEEKYDIFVSGQDVVRQDIKALAEFYTVGYCRKEGYWLEENTNLRPANKSQVPKAEFTDNSQ